MQHRPHGQDQPRLFSEQLPLRCGAAKLAPERKQYGIPSARIFRQMDKCRRKRTDRVHKHPLRRLCARTAHAHSVLRQPNPEKSRAAHRGSGLRLMVGTDALFSCGSGTCRRHLYVCPQENYGTGTEETRDTEAGARQGDTEREDDVPLECGPRNQDTVDSHKVASEQHPPLPSERRGDAFGHTHHRQHNILPHLAFKRTAGIHQGREKGIHP